MASPEAASTVMAAVFAYPQDASERRTRVYYASVFILAKSCALALTFVPAQDELSTVLFGLSIGNFAFSFLLDACARRESKRWAGEEGTETGFFHCFTETVLGAWLTHKLFGAVARAWQKLTNRDGNIKLSEEETDESEGPIAAVSSIFTTKPSPLEEWAKDISWAYSAGMFVKKVIAAAIVILRFLYDRWQEPSGLDIAARVLSSFVSLVLVDVLDGLAKEESRLRSKQVRTSIFGKMLGVFG